MSQAQQLSQALYEFICQKIAQNGGLPFSDYMQLALYHPTLGYYNNGGQKFGASGDFITAPEISPLFGQCIAAQIAPVLTQLPHAAILEFGAGSGQLAVDILQALTEKNLTPSHYYILELSAELQDRQRQKIISAVPHMQDKVTWLTSLTENFQGIVLANEVLDAMPVERFCFHDAAFWEYVVHDEEGAFKEKLTPAKERLVTALSKYAIAFSEGYHSEINLQLPAWLASLSDCMSRGLVLLIDYGFPRHAYYHPDRSMGTLMCHYQHTTQTDPYLLPGLQDITAHVDFTAVAESAISAGFELAGYTTQAHFLLSCGLMDLAAKQQTSIRENWGISQAIKKLVLPSEMGELFKVMALTKDLSVPMVGFEMKDMREKL
jgi:SAM-dependent MidA family methyltransferase